MAVATEVLAGLVIVNAAADGACMIALHRNIAAVIRDLFFGFRRFLPDAHSAPSDGIV